MSEYRLAGMAKMGETASKLLRSKVSNQRFRSSFEAAVKTTVKAQHLRMLQIIETFEKTKEGSHFLGGTRSAQAPAFTPPAPFYNSSDHKNFRDLVGDNRNATLLTAEGFYFAFGQQVNTVCIDQVIAEFERRLVLKPNLEQYYRKQGSSARSLVSLMLVEAILEASISRKKQNRASGSRC